MTQPFAALLIAGLALACFGACADTDADPRARACVASGGTVVTITCYCDGPEDFFDNCPLGVCTCPPDGEGRKLRSCDCGPGRCFDGSTCVPQPGTSGDAGAG